MLKQGIHPKVVQERLGHANIGITLDTYSHVTQGLQEAAAKGFDGAIKTGNSANNLLMDEITRHNTRRTVTNKITQAV
jgi:hypothetical protein